MASIGISEFSFGYAFLYEQTQANWGNLVAAPILPSLQQEQEEGWDAHLPTDGVDFYFQFKLSDYLFRENAKFIADGTYATPYYRLSFHRKDDNRQHRRLREHVVDNPHTYYVAPEFNSLDEFHAAFLNQEITQRSRMFPVADCDDINDGEQHYITFRENHARWAQHSEMKRHNRSFLGKDLEKVYRGTQSDWKRMDEAFARALFDKTLKTVLRVLEKEEPKAMTAAQPLLDFDPERAGRTMLLARTSQILSVVLGVTLVLIGSSE
jgi:hypothetical protein